MKGELEDTKVVSPAPVSNVRSCWWEDFLEFLSKHFWTSVAVVLVGATAVMLVMPPSAPLVKSFYTGK